MMSECNYGRQYEAWRCMASFFWVQSMVRDDSQRHMLFNLDESIQSLRAQHGDQYPEAIKLTSLYHNLIRMWAEV